MLARELVTGPSYVAREWDINSGVGTILGSSVASSGPADFNSASSSLDLNNLGVAAVPALVNGSTTTVLLIGNNRPLSQVASYSGAVGLRPQISDVGEAVIRDNVGAIVAWSPTGISYVAASSSQGFGGDTGNRPGISSDSTAIAFSGNRGFGPGIYVALRFAGSTPSIVPVAGGELADGFTIFPSEQRVGVSATHSTGSDIVTVVFEATLNGVDGIYTRQLLFLNGIAQPLTTALLIVKSGDSLGGSTITGYTLYKPINTQGQIVFSVQLADGSTAIVSKPPVQFGVDVNGAKGPVDWIKVIRSGKTFAFVKATEGVTFSDTGFNANITGARNAGLLVGAYHFARPLNNPGIDGAEAEARNFLTVAGFTIAAGYLPPVLDIEDQTNNISYSGPCVNVEGKIDLTCYLGDSQLSAWVRAWVQFVKGKTGVTPILYMNGNYAMAMDSDLNSSPLWIATFSGNPQADPSNLGNWEDWTFQQYSQSGIVDGISGNVDLDSFNGTLAQLGKLVVGGVPPVSFTGVNGTSLQPPLNGQFQIRVASPVVQEITVQSSPNLSGWSDVQTIIMNNSEGLFIDPNAAASKVKFYRPKP